MNFRFIMVMLMTLSMYSSLAQSVRGRVLGAGEPLPQATVYVTSLQKGATCDDDGYFEIDVPKEGVYECRVSYVGYATLTVNIATGGVENITLDSKSLEEVVISAVRPSADAPVAAVTRTKADIEPLYNGQDGAFLLEDISPSIISYSESGTAFGNYGQMRLRGIDQSRINITLNGVPLNDMIDQGVFFSNFIDFGNSISSVQVQRGVGTTTNGIASYAGSINFESVALDQEKGYTEAQLTYGSFNSARASVAYHSGLTENNMAFYGRFSRIYSEGYRYNTSTDAWSFFLSGGYVGKRHVIKVTAFDGRSQNGLAYSPVALSDILSDPRTNYQPENDRDFFGQWMVQGQHVWSLRPNTTLTSTLYYGGAGGDFPFTYEESDSASSSIEGINYPLYNDHYGVMSTFNHAVNRFSISTGVHLYRFDRVNEEQMLPDRANPYYFEESQKNEASAFARATWDGGKLKLFGDLQLRNVGLLIMPDENFIGSPTADIPFNFTFFNPKAGLTYNILENIEVYASVGRAGREPTKVDILGGFQLGAFNLDQVINTEVRPEYVVDYEAGVRGNLTLGEVKLRADINGFFMDFKNEIAPIGEFVPEGFIQLRKNIPSSQRYGVEGILQWLVGNSGFGMNNQFTAMRTNIDEYAPEGDQIYRNVEQALSPRFMTRSEVFWKNDRLRIGIEGRYIGEMFMEPTNNPQFTVPASYIWNAQVNIELMEQLSLRVHAENLTNQLYYTYGAPVDVDFDGIFDEPGYFVQPPRSIFGTLVFNF